VLVEFNLAHPMHTTIQTNCTSNFVGLDWAGFYVPANTV